VLSGFTFEHGETDYIMLRETFKREGVVVVRNLIDAKKIADFRETASAMIRARLESQGNPAPEGDDLDALYNKLCDMDRALGGEVYDHMKDTPQYHSCLIDSRILEITAELLGTTKVQAPHELSIFRIDRPSEDHFAFDWHQDYPYNLLSQNAVTAWFPLTDVQEDMGWLKVVPRAHARVRPVEIADPDYRPQETRAKTRSKAIRMVETDFEEFELNGIEVPMAAGDVMFFHCNTPHRSGNNRSKGRRARWVINPRYGDLLDASMVKRGWEYAGRKNFFLVEDLHPEITRRA
jgi:ectoine hydroxylase-related dioxygenase (phytanoyl-CoA dioxygenase family)